MLLHGILSGACSVTRRKQSNTSSRPVYLHGNFGVPSQQLDLARLTPTRRSSFADWWKQVERKLQKHLRKGFNSFCILGAWIIWKHRIACVFDGSTPNLQKNVQASKDEAHAWQFVRAKGLSILYLELGVVHG